MATATIAPASATETRVHRVLPNFESVSEFPDTPTDHLPAIRVACWVAAYMAIAHSYFNAPMTPQELVRLYDDMTAHGDMSSHGGTTMSAGDDYLRRVLHVQTVYPTAWHWHPGTQLDALHAGLVQQAGINGCILQVNQAGKLPHNEGGVGSHYIGIGGIDSVLGYLAANGDDVLALAGSGGHGRTFAARWMTWGELVAAEPTALLALPHPSQPSAVAIPSGWTDDGTTLTAPNHVRVVNGFRAYILALGSAWNPADWPLMAEVGDAEGAFQPTNLHELEWTPAAGVTATRASQAARFYLSLASQPKANPNAQPALDLLRAFKHGLETLA